MIETNFENCLGPLHCVCCTKIPWQGQREILPIDQSQSKDIILIVKATVYKFCVVAAIERCNQRADST